MAKTEFEPRNDPEKLAGIFAHHGPSVRHFLISRLGNAADAEDLAHETYLRLARVKDLDLIRNPEAYLIRIAANLANEFHLKQGRNPASVSLDDIYNTGADGDGMQHEENLQHRAEISKLEHLLSELPPHYAAVLLMRKRDGYSPAEIAERLDIAPSTVTTYLKRALALLREQWTE